MCVCFFAVGVHPEHDLVLALNRDEYYARPTAPAHFWSDRPWLVAGRDLEGGGTWLGVTREGRVALVTNFRDPASRVVGAPSRGRLPPRLLDRSLPPRDALEAVMKEAAGYNAFNLIVGDRAGLWFSSSRALDVVPVTPGIHGLSNALLDTPWPKVERGKREFSALLSRPGDLIDPLLALMRDRTLAADAALPSTGVPRELERALSPIFIETPAYGTRATTIVTLGRSGGGRLVELARGPEGPWTRTEIAL